MDNYIIEVNGLSYSYSDKNEILHDVDFGILEGERVALVGANGTGKTTLLLQLIGCLWATKGYIKINDIKISKKNIKKIRKIVGIVFQNSDDQLFMPTVFDDVAFGPINQGLSSKEVLVTVNDSLKKVNATHLKDMPIYKLSDGEKRIVSIAGVLAMSPKVLIMDEPTSNLDPQSRRNLIELLKTFNQTTIIATHDLDMALDICERTIVLNKGRIVGNDKTSDLLNDEQFLKNNGLELPLTLQKR